MRVWTLALWPDSEWPENDGVPPVIIEPEQRKAFERGGWEVIEVMELRGPAQPHSMPIPRWDPRAYLRRERRR
jgi:hypothetical protein